MQKIVTAAKLDSAEASRVEAATKAVQIASAVHQQKTTEYYALVNGLKQKYDPKYVENSKQQHSKYGAQVVDGILIITLD